jgi:hypothetical protein
VSAIVLGSLSLRYVLVPEGTAAALALIEVEVVSDAGRPWERLRVNPLQLASPRDPDLPISPAKPLLCERETALLANLQRKAHAASFVLPEIVPTEAPPPWARFTVSSHTRLTLWRAGGAL